jgi:putative transcriptional regulator
MTISHHADDATLMSYAAGSLPEALAAVLAAHLALCPRCRAEAARLERVGAILFDRLAPVPTGRPAPHVLASDLETKAAASEPRRVAGDVPAPLRHLVGTRLDDVPWRRLGIGIWHYRLPLSAGAKGDLRLYKVAPGQKLPEHGHSGDELTLLLRGCYRDEVGEFRTGDLADLDEEVEHRPIADAAEGCICLIGHTEPTRFKGLIARLMQPLTGV